MLRKVVYIILAIVLTMLFLASPVIMAGQLPDEIGCTLNLFSFCLANSRGADAEPEIIAGVCVGTSSGNCPG